MYIKQNHNGTSFLLKILFICLSSVIIFATFQSSQLNETKHGRDDP